jgi:hypothetical protein
MTHKVRNLNKLISFPDEKTKQLAEEIAASKGMKLKPWIERLIIKKINRVNSRNLK